MTQSVTVKKAIFFTSQYIFAFSLIVGLMLSFGSIASAHATGFPQLARQVDTATTEKKTIVIDPGHGGIDGGASGAGLVEKDLTLEISKRIRAYLVQESYQVQMTRETDTDVSELFPSKLSGRHKRDLQNRLDFIRKSQAVGALMIHINSSTKMSDCGPIVFYYAHSEAGKGLAITIQDAVNGVAGSTQRPIPRKNFFVLRHAPTATVLIEIGFVTNSHDVARLRSTAYRDQMARVIAHAAARTLRDVPIPPPFVKDAPVKE